MKTTFAAGADSILLGKKLASLALGEEISYEALERIVPGRDLRKAHRYLLDTARRMAMKDGDVVTGCVSGKGVKRLTNEEILDIAECTIGHIRRSSKKGAYKTLKADYEKLDEEGKARFNTGLSVLGAISQFTTNKVMNAVGDSVAAAKNRLPMAETLGLFLKNAK